MSRKNISLSEAIEERAQAIINARGFSGLSDLLATLIREEYERRHSMLQEGASAAAPAAPPPAKPVTYRQPKKRKRHTSSVHTA